MEKPRKLDFDISIITKEELSKDEIKMFLMVVRDAGPNGIISPYTRTYSDGAKANIFITMSVLEDGYKYQIPLKRNLTGDEAEAIVAEWVEEYDGDFDLEASSPILRMQDLSIFDNTIRMSASDFLIPVIIIFLLLSNHRLLGLICLGILSNVP